MPNNVQEIGIQDPLEIVPPESLFFSDIISIPLVSLGPSLLIVSAFSTNEIVSVTWNNIPLRRDLYDNFTDVKGGVYSLWVTDSRTGAIQVNVSGINTITAVSAVSVTGLRYGRIPTGSTGRIATGMSDTPAVFDAGIYQEGIYVHGVLATEGPVTDDPGNWIYNPVYSPGQVRYNGQRNGTNSPTLFQMTVSDGYDIVTSGNGQSIGGLYQAYKTGIVERNFAIAVVPYQ